jgi:hypothetical protein
MKPATIRIYLKRQSVSLSASIALCLPLANAVVPNAMVFAQDATDSSIQLVSPTGGESFVVGETLTVTWVLRNGAIPNGGVAVGLSPNEGQNWVVIVGNTIAADDPAYYKDSVGTFKWVILDSIKLYGRTYAKVRGNTCQVMVGAPYDGIFVASYSNNFTINQIQSGVASRAFSIRENSTAGHQEKAFTISGRHIKYDGVLKNFAKSKINVFW